MVLDKSQRIAIGTINIFTKFHGYLSNSCGDISVCSDRHTRSPKNYMNDSVTLRNLMQSSTVNTSMHTTEGPVIPLPSKDKDLQPVTLNKLSPTAVNTPDTSMCRLCVNKMYCADDKVTVWTHSFSAALPPVTQLTSHSNCHFDASSRWCVLPSIRLMPLVMCPSPLKGR